MCVFGHEAIRGCCITLCTLVSHSIAYKTAEKFKTTFESFKYCSKVKMSGWGGLQKVNKKQIPLHQWSCFSPEQTNMVK